MFQTFVNIGKAIYQTYKTYQAAINTALFITQGVASHKAAMKAKATGADILLQKYGTGKGIPVIYGTRRVAGTVVYMETQNNRELYVVYAIAAHEIDSFDLESIQLDGRTVKDTKIYRQGYDISDGTTRINFRPSSVTKASGTFWGNTPAERTNITDPANINDNARMTFNCHKGTTTQAADPMLEGILTDWTSNHKLTGIAYIAANYEYDTQGMFTGIPNLTVVVNGKKVFDPRDTGQTFGTESTYTHSSNAALCLLDYITNDEYGKGLGTSDLESDFASWKTAADDCDTSVDTINHDSISVESASTDSDVMIIASASQAKFNKLKVGNKYTVDDGTTTYINNKKLIDKDSTQIDLDGSNPFAILKLKFEDGAIDNAITSTTSCDFEETQIRFDCNGVIDTDETVLENTKLLIANMRGIFTYANGKYQIKVEGSESSVVTLDEDDILESGITLSLENKEGKYNRVEAEFYNAQKRYETDTTYYTGETSDTFLSDDGNEVLETRIQLPFCTNQRIAYNHAKALLKRSRKQKTISFVATPKILKAKVGEVITVSNTNLNLSSELYRITDMVINPDLNISVTAIEYQTDVYGYVEPPDEDIDIPNDPPEGNRVIAPTNLTFTNKNATTGEAAKLTWTDSTKYPSYEFRVRIIDGLKTRYDKRVKDTYFYLDGISVKNGYVAKVSAINALGTESDSTDITVNVTTEPITTPDIKQGSIGGFSFTDSKMYHPVDGSDTGTFETSNVYIDDDGQFSLKDKLSWDGSTLTIDGDGTFSGDISSATGTISNSIQIGSGESVFKADSNGIYLGNETFASAEFSVTPAGALKATSGTIGGFTLGSDFLTAGSAANRIKLSTADGIHMGNDTFSLAPFSVSKAGTVIAKDLILKKGEVTYFDSSGFSAEAIAQIASSLNTRVQTFAFSSENNTDYATIETTEDSQDIKLVVRANASSLQGSGTSEALAIAEIPDNLTIKIEFDDNTGFTSPTTIGSLQTYNASTDGTPLATEYEIETLDLSELGGDFSAFVLGNDGAVNASGDIVYTVSSYTVATAGTYYFRVIYDTTDTTFNATNDPENFTRSLEIEDLSGSGFLISNGSSGSQTSDAVTLTGTQTITGAKTFSATTAFSGNVNISGDLSVTGTTTTIDTATLNVEDKNITLNYATGDSSSTADGAGITIQDAVNSTTDATITWNATNDEFDFSHGIIVNGTSTDSDFLSGSPAFTTNSYIYTKGILNEGEAGTAPAGIVFGNGSTYNADNISLITTGNTAVYIDSTSQTTFNYQTHFEAQANFNGFVYIDVAGQNLVLQSDTSTRETIEWKQGATRYWTLDLEAGGDLNFDPEATTQAIKINGTEFVDESRNVSAGTISSGAITSTGDVGFAVNSGGNAYMVIDRSASNRRGALVFSTGATDVLASPPANATLDWSLGVSDSDEVSGDKFYIRQGDTNASGSALLIDSSNNATFAGTVTATSFSGDGSALTGIDTTTINSNADNRIITGSGTANTLNAEANLTYDGNILKTIGTNATLTVQVNATSGEDALLELRGARTTSSTSDIAKIKFDNKTSSAYTMAEITARDPSGSHTLGRGSLIFRTSAGGTLSDALLINQDKSATFYDNVTLTAGALSVTTDSDNVFRNATDNDLGHVLRTSNASDYAGHWLKGKDGNEDKFLIGYGSTHSTQPNELALKNNNSSGKINFWINATNRLELTSGGNLLQDGTYHLIGTDSGDAFNANAQFRGQSTGASYVQLKVGASSSGGILIGDTTDDFRGGLLSYMPSHPTLSNKTILFTNNTEVLTAQSNGNVGVGTTAPQSKLHIYDATINGLLRLESGDSEANIVFEDNSTTDSVAVGCSGDDLKLRTDEGNITFNTGTAGTHIERAKVQSDGTFRIGNSSSAALLVVSETNDTFPTIAPSTKAIFASDNTTAFDAGISLISPDDVSINFGDYNDEDAGAIIYKNSDDSMRFNTATGERMSLSSSGDLTATGTVTGNTLKCDNVNDGFFGSATFSWGGNGNYPTLYSSASDRWVMVCFPHIPYLQNGVNGFTGTTRGATMRMAANPAASAYWDIGISESTTDLFRIGRESSNAFEINNSLNATFRGNVLVEDKITARNIDADGRDIITIKTAANTRERGISFQNSGNAFSNSIFAEDVGGNDARLVFTGGNSSTTITSLSRDFMINNQSGGGGVSGDIHARGDVVAFSSTVSSDERLKYDIEDIKNPLDIIQSLKGRHFKWKKNDQQSSGVIAQEVEQSEMSFLVSDKVDIENPDETIKRVKYDGFIGVLIEAIKELKAEIEELKKQ